MAKNQVNNGVVEDIDPHDEDMKLNEREFLDEGSEEAPAPAGNAYGAHDMGVVDTEGLKKITHLSQSELLLGLVAILAWFGVFIGGSIISTEPYRRNLENFDSVGSTIGNALVICTFWTITNVGVLSCVASLLGALGGRSQFTIQTELHDALTEAPYPKFDRVLATYYVSAIMRGFGIYVLVLAGLLVLATESLVSPTQASYVRLAPTISIISFYAGYDPSLFAGLLGRVRSFVNTNDASAT